MSHAYTAARNGLLLALAVVISAAEGFLPLPLGVKPGLSNIIIMYAIIYCGGSSAFGICILKSFFVLLTRGFSAFFMSASGSVVSFVFIFLLYKKFNCSLLLTSVVGGIMHNMAQIAAACILMHTSAVIGYIPVLVIFGCIAGSLTGTCLNFLIPSLEKINMKYNKGG